MAMWDLYAKNGFLIRYDKDLFEEKIDELKKLNVSFTSRSVDYDNLNEIGFENGLKNANSIDLFFRKSKAFENENEFRLIKKMNSDIGKNFIIEHFFQIIDFEIFASPRMSSLDFAIYNKHFKNEYEVEIRQSEITDIIQLRENNF